MNIFKQLIKSIYSPKDIASFIHQRKRKSIAFVLLLAFITLIPATYYISQTLLEIKSELSTVIRDELPPFVIKEDKLFSDEKAPFIYKGDTVTYILDSTNTLTKSDVTDIYTIALLTDGIYFANDYIPYSYIGAFTNNSLAALVEMLTVDNTFTYTVSLIIYLISVITLFVFLLLELVLIALIGKLMARNKYTFGQMYRIAPYTMTLSTVFFFIMDWLQIEVIFASFTALFVTLIVMYLTVIELNKIHDQVVE